VFKCVACNVHPPNWWVEGCFSTIKNHAISAAALHKLPGLRWFWPVTSVHFLSQCLEMKSNGRLSMNEDWRPRGLNHRFRKIVFYGQLNSVHSYTINSGLLQSSWFHILRQGSEQHCSSTSISYHLNCFALNLNFG
jgi:hypothetical protein